MANTDTLVDPAGGGLLRDIRMLLNGQRVFDIHTHLGMSGPRQARDLAGIVSYHWLAVELIRALGRKIEANPVKDPAGYVREALPAFPAIRNTVNHYALMGMLRDLYGVKDRTITAENWERIDGLVREHAGDPGWLAGCLDRARVEKLTVARLQGIPDDSGRYVPYEYAEYLYATDTRKKLRALAGEEAPMPRTPEELEAAIRRRIDWLADVQGIRALHVWHGWPWVYEPAGPGEVQAALDLLASGSDDEDKDRKTLPLGLRVALASFAADVTASAAGGHGMVIQLFHGMMLYTKTSVASHVSDWDPAFLRKLAFHMHRNPSTRFDIFLATRIPGHEAASLARVYPNMMVSGAWWHGFTASTLSEFFRDRLEMLPNTAWNAFYSDGYIVEWIYAKLLVAKNRLAHALAGMVEEGFLVEDDVPEIAARLLYENATAAYLAG